MVPRFGTSCGRCWIRTFIVPRWTNSRNHSRSRKNALVGRPHARVTSVVVIVVGTVRRTTVVAAYGRPRETTCTVQYGLAPGAKSFGGYAVAGAVGVVAGKLSYSRTLGGSYYEGPFDWDKKLLDSVGVGFDWVKSIAGNFLRSFGASTASNLAPLLVGDTALGADIGSGPVVGPGGMTK